MAEVKRISLSLFMSAPLHAEAWHLLRKIPVGQRTEYICRAVCRMHDEDAVLDKVREMLREELGSSPLPKQKENQNTAEVGNVDDGVLDFLRALQEDGGEFA